MCEAVQNGLYAFSWPKRCRQHRNIQTRRLGAGVLAVAHFRIGRQFLDQQSVLEVHVDHAGTNTTNRSQRPVSRTFRSI